jgi:hypothetical protein
MGFEFKSDQPEQKLVDNKTTLSVNGTTTNTVTGYPTNATITELVGENAMAIVVEENLTQDIFAEGEEEQLAIEFLEENGLYTKFLLWCGIKDQLKKLKDSLATPTE